MTHGSTEVYLALQQALRHQTPISVHFPQSPETPGQITAVSHTYADIACDLAALPDSQLSLVRISFQFRDAIFSFSAAARRLSPAHLRIDTDTSGRRIFADTEQELSEQLSASTARTDHPQPAGRDAEPQSPGSDGHPGQSGQPVESGQPAQTTSQTAGAPAPQQWCGVPVRPAPQPTLPPRPQLQRLHSMLHHIRELLQPWGEHRISIRPAPSHGAPGQIVLRAALDHPPSDFCLPIIPATAQSQFDISVPIAYARVTFGSLDIIYSPTHSSRLPELLTKLSTCGIAIAHELMLPEDPPGLYTIGRSPFGSLLYSSRPIDTSLAGFQLPTPSGCCFTIPAGR